MTMRDFSQNHDWLSINTATVRKQRGTEVPLTRIIDQCAERGIRAISPWHRSIRLLPGAFFRLPMRQA